MCPLTPDPWSICLHPIKQNGEPEAYEISVNWPPLLSKAINIASTAHGPTVSKDGNPYILHPLRLMMKATTYKAKIVAVLHDTVEDTSLTLDDLRRQGFPDEIVEAIDVLSRREGEDYEDKLLDLYDNIDVTRLTELTDWDLKRTAKYHRSIKYLEGICNAA